MQLRALHVRSCISLQGPGIVLLLLQKHWSVVYEVQIKLSKAVGRVACQS